jgi:DNA-binding HxlR family transcriptional regulator
MVYCKDMKSQPTTDPGCVAAAVAILGDKWTPMLIRALDQQPLRFGQLQYEAGGVNPRTLSARLVRLEHCGILSKTVFDETPPHTEYSLTAKGRDLLPILQSMADWGEKHPPVD